MSTARRSHCFPDEDTFTRRIIDAVFKDHHIDYRFAFTTNYLETIKVMVEAGLGWSVLPKIMRSDALTHYDLPSTRPMRKLGIMLHKNKVMTPAIAAFMQALTAPKT